MSIFDKSLGVTLFKTLDSYVDLFKVGFWHMGNVGYRYLYCMFYFTNKTLQGQYVVHSFEDVTLNLFGAEEAPQWACPLLHGAQIDVGADPPPGVFNWHYLQCVLQKFATAAFRDIDNISYYVMPFCTSEDEDEYDSNSSEFNDPQNPPYPSYFFDRACSRAYEQWEDAQRHQDIEKWRSSV